MKEHFMSREERIRLECLKLAVSSELVETNILTLAKMFEAFVKNGDINENEIALKENTND